MTLIELFPVTAGLIVADILIGWILVELQASNKKLNRIKKSRIVWVLYMTVTFVLAFVIIGVYVMYAQIGG